MPNELTGVVQKPAVNLGDEFDEITNGLLLKKTSPDIRSDIESGKNKEILGSDDGAFSDIAKELGDAIAQSVALQQAETKYSEIKTTQDLPLPQMPKIPVESMMVDAGLEQSDENTPGVYPINSLIVKTFNKILKAWKQSKVEKTYEEKQAVLKEVASCYEEGEFSLIDDLLSNKCGLTADDTAVILTDLVMPFLQAGLNEVIFEKIKHYSPRQIIVNILNIDTKNIHNINSAYTQQDAARLAQALYCMIGVNEDESKKIANDLIADGLLAAESLLKERKSLLVVAITGFYTNKDGGKLGKFLEKNHFDKKEIKEIVAKLKLPIDIASSSIESNPLNRQDENGWTVLMHVVGKGCTKESIQELLKQGADPNLGNKTGDTVLMLAARAEDNVVFEEIFKVIYPEYYRECHKKVNLEAKALGLEARPTYVAHAFEDAIDDLRFYFLNGAGRLPRLDNNIANSNEVNMSEKTSLLHNNYDLIADNDFKEAILNAGAFLKVSNPSEESIKNINGAFEILKTTGNDGDLVAALMYVGISRGDAKNIADIMYKNKHLSVSSQQATKTETTLSESSTKVVAGEDSLVSQANVQAAQEVFGKIQAKFKDKNLEDSRRIAFESITVKEIKEFKAKMGLLQNAKDGVGKALYDAMHKLYDERLKHAASSSLVVAELYSSEENFWKSLEPIIDSYESAKQGFVGDDQLLVGVNSFIEVIREGVKLKEIFTKPDDFENCSMEGNILALRSKGLAAEKYMKWFEKAVVCLDDFSNLQADAVNGALGDSMQEFFKKLDAASEAFLGNQQSMRTRAINLVQRMPRYILLFGDIRKQSAGMADEIAGVYANFQRATANINELERRHVADMLQMLGVAASVAHLFSLEELRFPVGNNGVLLSDQKLQKLLLDTLSEANILKSSVEDIYEQLKKCSPAAYSQEDKKVIIMRALGAVKTELRAVKAWMDFGVGAAEACLLAHEKFLLSTDDLLKMSAEDIYRKVKPGVEERQDTNRNKIIDILVAAKKIAASVVQENQSQKWLEGITNATLRELIKSYHNIAKPSPGAVEEINKKFALVLTAIGNADFAVYEKRLDDVGELLQNFGISSKDGKKFISELKSKIANEGSKFVAAGVQEAVSADQLLETGDLTGEYTLLQNHHGTSKPFKFSGPTDYGSRREEILGAAERLCNLYLGAYGKDSDAILENIKSMLGGHDDYTCKFTPDQKIRYVQEYLRSKDVKQAVNSSSWLGKFIHFLKNILTGNWHAALMSAESVCKKVQRTLENAVVNDRSRSQLSTAGIVKNPALATGAPGAVRHDGQSMEEVSAILRGVPSVKSESRLETKVEQTPKAMLQDEQMMSRLYEDQQRRFFEFGNIQKNNGSVDKQSEVKQTSEQEDGSSGLHR